MSHLLGSSRIISTKPHSLPVGRKQLSQLPLQNELTNDSSLTSHERLSGSHTEWKSTPYEVTEGTCTRAPSVTSLIVSTVSVSHSDASVFKYFFLELHRFLLDRTDGGRSLSTAVKTKNLTFIFSIVEMSVAEEC